MPWASGKAIKKVSYIRAGSRNASNFSALYDLDYYLSLSNSRPYGLDNLCLEDILYEHMHVFLLRFKQILSQALIKNQKNSSSPRD